MIAGGGLQFPADDHGQEAEGLPHVQSCHGAAHMVQAELVKFDLNACSEIPFLEPFNFFSGTCPTCRNLVPRVSSMRQLPDSRCLIGCSFLFSFWPCSGSFIILLLGECANFNFSRVPVRHSRGVISSDQWKPGPIFFCCWLTNWPRWRHT